MTAYLNKHAQVSTAKGQKSSPYAKLAPEMGAAVAALPIRFCLYYNAREQYLGRMKDEG
jgi:hypothetical protein